MAVKVKPSVPRGMRDLLPEQMIKRQYVIDVIRGVFEEFGFEPLQTPSMEKAETLMGKYGDEAERLIYSSTYGDGKEDLKLRYDLSVPLCRVVAMYPDLPKPFKRYHIAPVWRADRPQKGRFREFYQCDADTVGSTSMLGDAETVAVIYTILSRLGFQEFVTYINSRKVLNGIGQYAGVPDSLLRGLYTSIDKLLKIGKEGVRQELLSVNLPQDIYESLRRVSRLYLQEELNLDEVGRRLREETVANPDDESGDTIAFPENIASAVEVELTRILEAEKPGSIEPDQVQLYAGELVTGVTPILRDIFQDSRELIPGEVVDRLLELLEVEGSSNERLDQLTELLADFPEALEGLEELREMFLYLDILGVPEAFYEFDISMARGLEYYTGPIYETNVKKPNIGSITGGGRFDKLVGMFLDDQDIPATGTTIGIERIIVVMDELDMFPPNVRASTAEVLVTVFTPELRPESLKITRQLREAGFNTQIYFDADSLRDQLGYAATKGIPFAVILGPDEAEKSQIAIRNLSIKKQQVVERDALVETIREWTESGTA